MPTTPDLDAAMSLLLLIEVFPAGQVQRDAGAARHGETGSADVTDASGADALLPHLALRLRAEATQFQLAAGPAGHVLETTLVGLPHRFVEPENAQFDRQLDVQICHDGQWQFQYRFLVPARQSEQAVGGRQ